MTDEDEAIKAFLLTPEPSAEKPKAAPRKRSARKATTPKAGPATTRKNVLTSAEVEALKDGGDYTVSELPAELQRRVRAILARDKMDGK